MQNLVIVESPAKAKTIEKYLGKDWTVMSSVGHIREIPASDKNAIDVKDGFKTKYVIDPEKTEVVRNLEAAVKKAKVVWLATDEDREGEAIAWHLAKALGLDLRKTNRIAFHEITKPALEYAVEHPRKIDMNLVEAQQARQILDRLVGFELSPVVWRKVPGGKSAGRVQSPAVRLIVEREREIKGFDSEFSFKVSGDFYKSGLKNTEKNRFKAELAGEQPKTEVDAHKLLESLKNQQFRVANIVQAPGSRNPGPPFTTSTLQQEANSRLGFSARTTMSAAQGLYQAGHITYMRTDATVLSKQALAACAGFIEKAYGKNYSKVRQFATKSASAQEAHEAIRPTHIGTEKAGKNQYEQKLYDLIRRRTLASQMSPATLEKTTVTITCRSLPSSVKKDIPQATAEGESAPTRDDGLDERRPFCRRLGKDADDSPVFEAKGEIIIFDGFLKVYGAFKQNELPRLSGGDELAASEIIARQTFANPPARYTEGSLVKKLESLGIGRPSTYATILNTIQTRGYVKKGESEGRDREVIELKLDDGQNLTREVQTEKTGSDRGKLVPDPVGEILSDFLHDYFTQVVDYGFTADVEKDFDAIAEGEKERNEMLEEFYKPFHQLIEGSDKIDRAKVGKARLIGKDPKTGKDVIARIGRYGPMLQLGEAGETENSGKSAKTKKKSDKSAEKPRFAPLPDGETMDSVTLAQALEMFKLPRTLGQTDDGNDIKVNIGRFGPYVQVDKTYASIKPPLTPFDITLEQARELYAAKLKADAEKRIAEFPESGIKVLNGPYGAYVTDGKKNVRVPKETDPKSLTEVAAKKLIDEAPDKPRRGPRRFAKKKARSAAKKTAKKASKKVKKP